MSYPPAPWHLYGTALQSVHAIDLASAKAHVPKDLEIVSVLPGKTIGGVYLSVYESNSTLQYHELIAIAALVRYQGKIGAWISHIYVDNPDSVAGGINIWGLPKQMAEFTWHDRHVTVTQANITLCQLDRSNTQLPLSFWGKLAGSVNVFSGLERDILTFTGDFESVLAWTPFKLNIPAESPFSTLNLGRPLLGVQLNNLHLTANIPTVVGSWTDLPVSV